MAPVVARILDGCCSVPIVREVEQFYLGLRPVMDAAFGGALYLIITSGSGRPVRMSET